MTDGIIKGTGNSRYLKGAGWPSTYAEFKAMAEAGTLPFDLNGINAAGWQVIGSLLNKANLLSDATCSLLNIPTSSVPDNVFEKLALYVKVGDIRTTTRTNLGSKWLLCNGAKISKATYPTLAALLPSSVASLSDYNKVATSNVLYPQSMIYKDGVYICVTNSQILYTATPWITASWAVVYTASDGYSFHRVRYCNGYYIVVGSCNVNGYLYPAYAYSNSLTGTWITNTPYGTSYRGDLTDVLYCNSYFHFYGYTSDGGPSGVGAYDFYKSTITGTINAQLLLANAGGVQVATNGTCILLSCGGASPILVCSSGVTYTSISTAPATNSWTINKIEFVNNTWLLHFRYTSSPYNSIVCFSTSATPPSSIASNYVTIHHDTLGSCSPLLSIYLNGKWVLYYADPNYPGIDVTETQLVSGTTVTSSVLLPVGVTMTYMAGASDAPTPVMFISSSCYSIDPGKVTLPEISVDKAYNYIKALEG